MGIFHNAEMGKLPLERFVTVFTKRNRMTWNMDFYLLALVSAFKKNWFFFFFWCWVSVWLVAQESSLESLLPGSSGERCWITLTPTHGLSIDGLIADRRLGDGRNWASGTCVAPASGCLYLGQQHSTVLWPPQDQEQWSRPTLAWNSQNKSSFRLFFLLFCDSVESQLRGMEGGKEREGGGPFCLSDVTSFDWQYVFLSFLV